MKKKVDPARIVISVQSLIFIPLIIINIVFISWWLKEVGITEVHTGMEYLSGIVIIPSIFPLALIDFLCCHFYIKTIHPKGIVKIISYASFVALSFITSFFGWIALTWVVIPITFTFLGGYAGGPLYDPLIHPLFIVTISIVAALLSIRFLLPKTRK